MKKLLWLFLLMLFLLSACGGQPVIPGYALEEIVEDNDDITEYIHVAMPFAEHEPVQEAEPIPNISCFSYGHEELIDYDFPIPLYLVTQFFAEFCTLATADGGYLWGHSLHVPFIFLHTETRSIVANQPDSLGILARVGSVYTGTLPERFPAAYSFPRIGDRQWAMLPWHELYNEYTPLRTMAHMSMHVHQQAIFGSHSGWDNSHMNNKNARITIQLEISALIHALGSTGEERYAAIQDALSIRAERRRLFPSGAVSENVFEVHEGLADYTDIRIIGLELDELISEYQWRVSSMRYHPSLSGIFGYLSGSLYGLLLDETGIQWRGDVRYGVDLGRKLQDALEITYIPAFADIDLLSYGYYEIVAFETEREQSHSRMLDDIRDAFTTQPTLSIPGALVGDSMQINPARIFPVARLGVAYGGPTVIVSGVFGYLTVYDGFMVHPDGVQVRMVVATDMITNSRRFTAPGWILELNSGFRLNSQNGNYIVERE